MGLAIVGWKPSSCDGTAFEMLILIYTYIYITYHGVIINENLQKYPKSIQGYKFPSEVHWTFLFIHVPSLTKHNSLAWGYMNHQWVWRRFVGKAFLWLFLGWRPPSTLMRLVWYAGLAFEPGSRWFSGRRTFGKVGYMRICPTKSPILVTFFAVSRYQKSAPKSMMISEVVMARLFGVFATWSFDLPYHLSTGSNLRLVFKTQLQF